MGEGQGQSERKEGEAGREKVGRARGRAERGHLRGCGQGALSLCRQATGTCGKAGAGADRMAQGGCGGE